MKMLDLAVALGALALPSLGWAQGHSRPAPPGPTELTVPSTTVPLDLAGDRPVVEAKLNGRGPFKFILDTGAGGVVLDQTLAEELGLEKLGEAGVGDPSGSKRIEASASRLASVEVGAAVFRDVPCVYWPRPPLTGGDGPRGIIGFPLFRELLLTLDLPRGRLRLERGELPAPDGERIIAFERPRGIPQVPIEVGGRRMLAHLDTGAPGNLNLPDPMSDSLPLLGPPMEIGRARTVNSDMVVRAAQLDGEFRLGGRAYPKLEVTFNSLPVANVGMGLLRGFELTFDQRNQRMRLAPDTSVAAPPSRTKRYGIVPAMGDGPLRVERVTPDSPAERAGLRAGDVVLEIDNTPTAGMDFAARGAALRRPAIKLKLRRGEKTMEIAMSLD